MYIHFKKVNQCYFIVSMAFPNQILIEQIIAKNTIYLYTGDTVRITKAFNYP